MTKQTIVTPRFGEIEYEQHDVLHFTEPLLGFPNSSSFIILSHEQHRPFKWLQCLDDPSIAFLVIDPANVMPNYAPELPETGAQELQLLPDTPRIVYVIANIPKGKPQDITLNLAAPIVINAEKGIAKQVIVEDPQYSIRQKILQEQEIIRAEAHSTAA
jgi:flagellar assembly factor FliW